MRCLSNQRFTLTRNAGRAFTIVEVLLVLVILGMVATIAVPRFSQFSASRRLASAERRILSDLAWAQRMAKQRGTNVAIRFYTASDYYVLVSVDDPDHAGRDYTVQLGDPPYEVSMTAADLDGDAKLIFDGYGFIDGTGTITLEVGAHQRIVNLRNASFLLDKQIEALEVLDVVVK